MKISKTEGKESAVGFSHEDAFGRTHDLASWRIVPSSLWDVLDSNQ